MAPDDAADLLGELPEERSEEVLQLMEDEESEDVRQLLTYEDDTAGGIMTTDVIAMKESQTVGEALDAIAHFDEEERFFYAYTVTGTGELTGYVDIWELLRTRDRGKALSEMVHRDIVAAGVSMDQEEVAALLGKYDLSALPVVDDDSKLIGRVTADDVIDVLEEEASEDIFRLAGSDDVELETSSPLRSCAVRLPWLLITLLGGFLTSYILNRYRAHVSGMLILVAFVPIVLAMGGNAGNQSPAVMERITTLGSFRGRGLARMLLREVLTGALMGIICGTIIGIWAKFMIRGDAQAALPFPAIHLASVVALALFSAMTFAAMFGALVPVILHKARVDPAIASGPFITIANDISALLIYFGVTLLLIQSLG